MNEFFMDKTVQKTMGQMNASHKIEDFVLLLEGSRQWLVCVMADRFITLYSNGNCRCDWSSQWGEGGKDAYMKRAMVEGRHVLYRPKSEDRKSVPHCHAFGFPHEVCRCGMSHMEWVAAGKPLAPPDPYTYIPMAEPSQAGRIQLDPKCKCGAMLTTVNGFTHRLCGDCRAELKKEILRESLDRRIVAARVDVDPQKDWSAWSTATSES